MRFIAGNCRVGALTCLLFAFALSCVTATVLLTTPATALEP